MHPGTLPPTLTDAHFESHILRLHAAIDVPGFWAALQAVLRDLLPHDACIVYRNFRDFPSTWRASQILATSQATKPDDWHHRRRAVDVMPKFILSHPGLRAYRLSDVVPDSRTLRGSDFFRDYMQPDGWCYSACSLFWQNGGETGRAGGSALGLNSEIAIRRTAEQGDFSPAEMALLDRLHPHIQTTLQRLSALERRSEIRLTEHPRLIRLTPAERQLVHLMREGCSNKEMAQRLGKHLGTVKIQLTSVYKKTGVRSRTQLLALL